MKDRLILLLFLIPLVFSCQCGVDSKLLEGLDGVLADKATYDAYFADRVTVLRSVLHDQDDPGQIYNIHKRLAEAYEANSFDSTMVYLNKNRALAAASGDHIRIAETDMMMVEAYTKAGYLAEAAEVLHNYHPESVAPAIWKKYLESSHRFYGEMSAYSSDSSVDDRRNMRDFCRNELLKLTPEDTYDWYWLKQEEAEASGDRALMKKYAGEMVKASQVNSHEYAIACYHMFDAHSDDSALAQEWLIRSAIADVMCAIKDYTSLNMLSEMLYMKGDIERAFRYAADHCMPDALYFNGRLRPWQISQFLPQLEKAYNHRNLKQMRVMAILIVVISCFLAIMVFLLFSIFKRQRILVSVKNKLQASYKQIDERNQELVTINDQLTRLNAQIQEADKVKQEYIALFLGILSENINKTRQYKNHVLKYIRQGNTGRLVDEIEALPPIDEDISQFYKMFDETFINLYPDFVEKFNALLVDGAAIVPKGDDILTPELRIFALIKLGITDSSKIASLLHYSANTIYNYRAKTKNKARVSRDEFETVVRNIE